MMNPTAVICRTVLASIVVLAAVALPVPLSAHASSTVTCTNTATQDTAALQNALNTGGTINIAAGTCALNARLAVKHDGTTVNGAGQTATILQQHAVTGVIEVGTFNSVTVENLTMDSHSFNKTAPMPQPGTLYSAGSNNSVLNVTAIAGSGFDIRLTGSSPCDAYPTHGTVVSNVNVQNTGLGGYTPLDIDCTNGGTVTNATVTGQYIAVFLDQNVTVNGETYAKNVQQGCSTPVYVTTKPTTKGILVENVTGGGKVKIVPASAGVTVVNDIHSPGC